MKWLLLAAVLASFVPAVVPEVAAKDIHKEKSLYRNIVVREQFYRRCLVFSVKRGDRNQTCMDLRDPRRLVFPYVRMSFAGLLLNPNPERVLVIGLGGGSVPLALAELYPQAHIDVVEIDSAVVRVAEDYFNFEETDRLKVAVADARVFVKRALLNDETWDFVMLDAFTGDYIPEHLMTVEFLQEVRDVMTADGVLVSNTFSTSALYDHESVTYTEVFGPFLNFKMSNTGNRVIVAAREALPDDATLTKRAGELAEALLPYDVDIESYPAHLDRRPDWNRQRRILTDQYSPANLLRGDLY